MDEIKPARYITLVFFQQSGCGALLVPPSTADTMANNLAPMVQIHANIIKMVPIE